MTTKTTTASVTEPRTPKKSRAGSTRNRDAGHQYERDTVNRLKHLYPNLACSRACNRVRDAEKADLAHPDEVKYGRFPYNIQCKAYTGGVSYLALHREMPQDGSAMNVIFHKYNVKKKTRFYTVGEFAITTVDSFVKMMNYRRAYELLNAHFDQLPKEIQDSLIGQLESLEV